MQTLYNGVKITTTIRTNERIFKVKTFDDDLVLCNVKTAKKLLKKQMVKNLWHLWDLRFEVFSKEVLKQM